MCTKDATYRGAGRPVDGPRRLATATGRLAGVMLSDRSLAWLRHLEGATVTSDDVLASALSVGLMARRTPAWIEPHVRILDQLVDRLDADLDTYSGTDIDSGPLLLLLGLRAALGLDDEGSGTAPDPGELAEQLCRRWEAAPADGPSLGDDLVPALDLALTGLGLRLHDTTNGTNFHQRAFAPWWDRVGAGIVEASTTPTADPATTLSLALLLAPQAPAEARQLFDAGVATLSRSQELAPPLLADRANALALLGAREWDAEGQVRELASAIDSSPLPSTDDDDDADAEGHHTFGSPNALLAMAEATEAGRWSAMFTEPVAPCPQVIGVEFPEVALFRAEWINGALHVGQAPLSENGQRWTTFRLVGGEPRMWYLTGIDGAMMDTAGSAVVVRVPQVRGELEFAPGSY